MNSLPFATGARVIGAALFLTLGVNPSTAETFRWGDSTASVQQRDGSHQSRSDVTRFEDGQRIITRDGNNTDITIQREGHSAPPRFDAEQRFGEGNDRFDDPDLERRFSQPDPFDSNGSPSSTPDTSQAQKLFLLHMMERFGWHFMLPR